MRPRAQLRYGNLFVKFSHIPPRAPLSKPLITKRRRCKARMVKSHAAARSALLRNPSSNIVSSPHGHLSPNPHQNAGVNLPRGQFALVRGYGSRDRRTCGPRRLAPLLLWPRAPAAGAATRWRAGVNACERGACVLYCTCVCVCTRGYECVKLCVSSSVCARVCGRG